MAAFSLLSILIILLWSVPNTKSRHLPDNHLPDNHLPDNHLPDDNMELVKWLSKQSYNNTHGIFLPKITENWKETSFDPDRWIASDFQEIWLRFGRGGTPSDRDEFLKYVLIKRIEHILFEGLDNFFLRLAWEDTLRDKTSNCYADDKECRPRLAKLTIKKVCRTLVYIEASQHEELVIKLIIITAIRILKFLAHPMGIFADVTQFVLEYYAHEIIMGKIVGVVGSTLLAGYHSGNDAAANAFWLWTTSEVLRWVAIKLLS